MGAMNKVSVEEEYIERLDFEKSPYKGIEAAIHLARYSFVKDSCKGKRVLDIACGAGYGAKFYLGWGAVEVVGVDISETAIAMAKSQFSSEGINFLCGDILAVLQKYGEGYFDLVTSFETVEHVLDPNEFLTGLKKAVKPSGHLVISCPNDLWYYPKESLRNPYHLRKYSFENFKMEAEASLGPADVYYVGTAAFGFCNIPLVQDTTKWHGFDGTYISGLNRHLGNSVQFLPTDESISNDKVGYYVGVWGNESGFGINGAVTPNSMDEAALGHGMRHHVLPDEQPTWMLQEQVNHLTFEVDSLKRQLNKVQDSNIYKAYQFLVKCIRKFTR